MRLSPDQRNAATRTSQDVCVVAGPGSGKTRVLIARFSWLVTEQRVPPARILAITFTEKAATEIKVRLVEALQTNPALRQQIERAYVSTIHGFCARLLKENAVMAGVDLDFAVLDEPQSQALLAEAAEEALDAVLAEDLAAMRRMLESLYVSNLPGGRNLDLAGALIRVYDVIRVAGVSPAWKSLPPGNPLGDLTAALRKIIDQPEQWRTPALREKRTLLAEWLLNFGQLSDALVTARHFEVVAEFPSKLGQVPAGVREDLKHIREQLIPGFKAHLADRYFAPLKDVLLQVMDRMAALYRAKKRARTALDFSDLEEQTLELLAGHRSVQERIRDQFDYVLMDELQDTNPLQWRILNLIRRPDRFFGVGDINQSIYGFRHADPEVFREFRDGLLGQSKAVDRLIENHRSRAGILQAVGALFTGVDGIEEHRLEPRAQFGPAAEPCVEVLVAAANETAAAEQREALLIARRIRELQDGMNIPFSSFAVLGRKSSALETIERGLRDFRIPALVIGGRTLMESREVRDVLQFLRILANTRDEISLAGVLRSPLVGVRDETLLRLKQNGFLWPSIAALDARETTIDEADLDRLLWLRETVDELRLRRDAVSPDRLGARIVDESDYVAGLDAAARRNLTRFFSLLRDLYEREPRPLAELLDEVEQLRNAESLAEAPPAEAANAVRLMTVHAAKGLEFPVVFVAALNQKTQDDVDPITFSPHYGIGVRWRDPATGGPSADAAYSAIAAGIKQRTRDEESRLLYVAATRAKEHLALSWSVTPKGHGSPWSKLVAGKMMIEGGEFVEEDSIRSFDGIQFRLIRSAQSPPGRFEHFPETQEPVELPVAKPALNGQHDAAVPVTHIGTFLACPRRYYLAHYLGFTGVPYAAEFEDRRVEPAIEVGTYVHQILAGMPVESHSAEVQGLVDTFRSSPLAARVARAARVEREFDFVMEFGGLVIRGQIDLWFEEGGELVLVDYKTDQLDPAAEPSRVRPYAFQLLLYAHAVRKLTGRLPDRALLFFLRSNLVIPVLLDSSSLAAATETVARFRDAQDNLEFPLHEGEQCRRCEFYRGLCPAGRINGTDRVFQISSFGAAP
jgi:ATP-dependent exoDNAse (exonuclease V) beta subunit